MKTNPPINQIVKDPKWQIIRTNLLGRWAKDPVYCCNLLSRWIGSIKSAEDSQLAILANYLTGTGFRTGRIVHPCISSLRTRTFQEIKERKLKKTWKL